MTRSSDDEVVDRSSKAAMTLPATFVIDTPGDAARAAELRRVKLLATLVLAATFAIFLGAKALLPVHPAFGFIAAFAEAATIGGLADWYAVVALFKRPLGLPIPHTAIIQSNQHRIADKLGEFIEVHFLEAAPVEAKLRQIDFGSFIADWLRDRKRSEDLARFALRLLPEAVAATENSGLMTFVSRRITAQLMSIDLAPLAAGTLRAFVKEGRHQGLLDDILRAVHQTLTQAETMAMIREKIRAELPTLLKLYRADKFLVNKIVASASAFFEEVRNDPEHPFRGEFDRMVLTLRRPARHRSGLCRAHRRPEARSAGAARTRPASRATSGTNARIVLRTQRLGRDAGAAAVSGAHVRDGRRGAGRRRRTARRDQPGPRRRAANASSPNRRAASRPSSPTRSNPGTWGS